MEVAAAWARQRQLRAAEAVLARGIPRWWQQVELATTRSSPRQWRAEATAWSSPATVAAWARQPVAGSGGGAGSGNPAMVATSGVGDLSVKPTTVVSGGDRLVKPATAASDGSDSGKSVMAASSGDSSGRAMLHGIEIPKGMDPAISFLLTIRMDTYQVALDGSMRRCSEFDYPLIVESSMNFNEVQQARYK